MKKANGGYGAEIFAEIFAAIVVGVAAATLVILLITRDTHSGLWLAGVTVNAIAFVIWLACLMRHLRKEALKQDGPVQNE